MKVQTIRDGSIALITSMDELSARGIGTLNAENTADIVRRAFLQAGMDARGEIAAEAYINGAAVLIFARVLKAAVLCRMADTEAVIDAAQVLQDVSASLIYCQGWYYLALHTRAPRLWERVLREYGELEDLPELRYAHLAECGKMLCRGNAAEVLRRSFRPAKNSFFADSLPLSE